MAFMFQMLSDFIWSDDASNDRSEKLSEYDGKLPTCCREFLNSIWSWFESSPENDLDLAFPAPGEEWQPRGDYDDRSSPLQLQDRDRRMIDDFEIKSEARLPQTTVLPGDIEHINRELNPREGPENLPDAGAVLSKEKIHGLIEIPPISRFRQTLRKLSSSHGLLRGDLDLRSPTNDVSSDTSEYPQIDWQQEILRETESALPAPKQTELPAGLEDGLLIEWPLVLPENENSQAQFYPNPGDINGQARSGDDMAVGKHVNSHLANVARPLKQIPQKIQIWIQGSPDYESHSCRYCQTLILTAHRSKVKPGLYSRSREQILEAAQNGCVLFLWVKEHLSDSNRHVTFSPTSGRDDFDIADVRCELNDEDELSHENGPLLKAFTFSNDQAASCISARPLRSQLNSEKNFALIRQWLDACHEDPMHAGCRSSNRSYLPTRIIYLGGKNGKNLRLCKTENNSDKYAALSYCWGGDQEKTKTTTDNLNDRFKGFSLKSLPKTIKDAVIITRKLEIDYLWVDALCIIQNDENDKMREVSRMPTIFHGAFVTISAASARNCNEGFLLPNLPRSVKLPYQLPGGEWGSIYLVKHVTPMDEPIHTRAWTLQEHSLSSRVLEFGSNQLRGVCRGSVPAGSDTTGSLATIQHMAYCKTNHYDATIHDKSVWFNKIPAERIRIKYWRPLLQDYTRRNLTDPDDRLNAISGIAAEYAKLLDYDYVAGLWASRNPTVSNRSVLALELLWYNCNSKYPHRRPTTYRAPTWAWASIDGPIQFNMWPEEEIYVTLEILKFQVQPKHLYLPKGAIKCGYLKVRGNVRKAVWTGDRSRLCSLYDSTVEVAIARPDAIENEFDTMGVQVTVVCLEVVSEWHGMAGLILVSDNRCYRRVGFFTSLELKRDARNIDTGKTWKESCRKEEITIV